MPSAKTQNTIDFAFAATDDVYFQLVEEDYEGDSARVQGTGQTIRTRLGVYKNFLKWLSLRFPDHVGLQKHPFIDTPEHPLSSKSFPVATIVVLWVLARIHAYMNIRVHVSKGKGRKGERMKFQTLLSLKWALLSIANQGKYETDTGRDGYVEFNWADALKVKYNLKSLKPATIVFGIHELRILISEALRKPQSLEGALQYVVVLLLAFFTGVRPGSIFATRDAQTFLELKSLRLVRSDNGWGWDVVVTYVVFKGYEKGFLTVSYTIRCPSEPRHLFAYLAAYLILLGIIRGDISGHSTLESIRLATAHVLKWNDDTKPVFRTMQSRTTMKTPIQAMSDKSFLEKHHIIAARCGMDGEDDQYGATLYGMRKYFATRMTLVKGPDAARTGLAHRYNSATLMEVYNQSQASIDFFAVATGEEDRSNREVHGNEAAIFAGRADPLPVLSLEQLCTIEPELAAVLLDANFLDDESNATGSDWKTKLVSKLQLESDDTPQTVLAWLSKRAKYLTRQARETEHRRAGKAATANRRAQMTQEQFMAARDRLENPASLQHYLAAQAAKSTAGRLNRRNDPAGPGQHTLDYAVNIGAMDEDDDAEPENIPLAIQAQNMLSDLLALNNLSPFICDQCWDDETTPEEDRGKDWATAQAFHNHKQRYHEPLPTLQRFLLFLGAVVDDEFVCPWCPKMKTPKQWRHRADLVEHIVETHGEEEVNLKYMLIINAGLESTRDKTNMKALRKKDPAAAHAIDTAAAIAKRGTGSKPGPKPRAPPTMEELQCPRCLDDDTLPHEDRNKVFSDLDAVRRHTRSDTLHSPQKKALRLLYSHGQVLRQKFNYREVQASHFCPYDCEFESTPKLLWDHILHIHKSHTRITEKDFAIYAAAARELSGNKQDVVHAASEPNVAASLIDGVSGDPKRDVQGADEEQDAEEEQAADEEQAAEQGLQSDVSILFGHLRRGIDDVLDGINL
ncbi:hypothetical protein C8R46DRAFT_1230595 [Mycena filopes]|nr:hypothetical protein C8R46DRAFT_1230595 [Mycena filopes]